MGDPDKVSVNERSLRTGKGKRLFSLASRIRLDGRLSEPLANYVNLAEHHIMQISPIFPVPVAHEARVIEAGVIERLLAKVLSYKMHPNPGNATLRHSDLRTLGEIDPSGALEQALRDCVIRFGSVLLGEALPWTIKESWANVMNAGGGQPMHAHGNCLISGVLYLTPVEEGARLVFHKPVGGHFILSNFHADTQLNEFNAPRRQTGEVAAGDLILFPSHLLHSVPENTGRQRVSIAFNAIPERLSTWGYDLKLA